MENKNCARGAVALATVGAGILVAHMLTTRTAKGRMMRATAEKIRGHIASRLAKVGKVTKKSYGRLVDAAIDEYKDMKTLSAREFEELSSELKSDWAGLKSALKDEEEVDDEDVLK